MAARNKSSRRQSPTPQQPAIDWQHVLGPIADSMSQSEREELQSAANRHPRRAIRLYPGRSTHELPMEVSPVPWYSCGYFVASDGVRPGEWLHYAAGDYYIQDAGSMLALALCQVSAGDWVCDVCAAPGGKATGALEQLDGTGLLVANEVIGSRLGVLQQALARSGYANYLTFSCEAELLADTLCGSFDCVIVDAPCTGQTMIGRGKQVLAAYSAPQIEHSAARQRRIIRAASELVAPGGRLVYSTCAFSYTENEQVVFDYLEEHPGWQLHQSPELADWQSPCLPGCYRLWPHRDHCGGAFAAAILRPAVTKETALEQHTVRNYRGGLSPSRNEPTKPEELEWLASPINAPSLAWLQKGKLLHAFPQLAPAAWHEPAVAGIAIAERQSDRWEPHAASAMLRPPLLAARSNVELSDSQATGYVAGEALSISHPADQGWTRVWWRQRPLGWGKLVAGVLKNHYPKSLRQRQHA